MEEKYNPLRNETVIVRLVYKENPNITDKHHMIYGGMAENATKTYTVPIIASSGSLKNVLTNDEKNFFEDLLGVNLSVHNKNNNYWANYKVRLPKQDTILDLSNPNDYIKYKVLLANTNFICPSLEQLEKKPLATYQYVIIEQGGEVKYATDRRKVKVECYKLAGKLEKDFDTLRTVVEMLDKRPQADNTTVEFLSNKLDEFIDANAKEVYKILTDPGLSTMVLIKKGIRVGLISKTGDFYYLKNGNTRTPLCADGKDPDFKNAIQFLNNPKNQELKFNLEAQINNKKDE